MFSVQAFFSRTPACAAFVQHVKFSCIASVLSVQTLLKVFLHCMQLRWPRTPHRVSPLGTPGSDHGGLVLLAQDSLPRTLDRKSLAPDVHTRKVVLLANSQAFWPQTNSKFEVLLC